MDVPSEIATLPQWINWRYVGDKKMPINPRNGYRAKTNRSATWTDLATASATGEMLGFVFAANGGVFGVDLDGCIIDGEVQDWALNALALLPTYAEISPSGTGIKIFGKGKIPRERGKKREISGVLVGPLKKPAIEAYDHGRFFAFTGNHYPDSPTSICDCQDGLNTIVDMYWPERKITPVPTRPINGCTNIEQRAIAYLAKLPPAISGSGGHNQTFRAACVLVLGFGLELEIAFRVLADWNQGCNPPWTDAELWHKLTDANNREGERGWLLNGGRYEGPDVDLRALLASVDAEPANAPGDPDAFPVDCLRVPGLIGDVIEYTLRTSIYPQPELALAAAIALMGTITGRKVRDEQGTRTNVYVMGLCPPASGKERARAVNKEILTQAGGERFFGPESIGSSAGMISALADQPALLFQLDEIGRLFQTMQSATKATHLFNVGSQFLKLYAASDQIFVGDAYADLKKTKRINQPHACIYGTSVPETFWSSLTAENVSEGLVGRFMVFDSSHGYVMPQKREFGQLSTSIVDRVRWWLDFVPGGVRLGNLCAENPTPIVVKYGPESEKRITEHVHAIATRRNSEHPTHAAIWSRSAEKSAKLALIFACSRYDQREPAIIDIEDVHRGIRIANWLTRRMLRKVFEHVSANQVEATAKKLLSRIDKTGITLGELTRRSQWMRSKERQEVISDLLSAGYACLEERESTGGRKATVIKRLV